jgi:hypothetical protein
VWAQYLDDPLHQWDDADLSLTGSKAIDELLVALDVPRGGRAWTLYVICDADGHPVNDEAAYTANVRIVKHRKAIPPTAVLSTVLSTASGQDRVFLMLDIAGTWKGGGGLQGMPVARHCMCCAGDLLAVVAHRAPPCTACLLCTHRCL